MWGRRFRYKSYQARLCWGSTAPWLHTLICSTYCLKKNDQHIVKPFCRICSNCLCFYCYPSAAVQLVLTSSHLCFLILFSNGKIHPLTYIHHTSTYQASLCKLMEYWWTDVLFVFFFFSILTKLRWTEILMPSLDFLQPKPCNQYTPGPSEGKWNSGNLTDPFVAVLYASYRVDSPSLFFLLKISWPS